MTMKYLENYISFNESIIQYSGDFIKILKGINNKVSIKLLDLYTKDIDTPINHIDLGNLNNNLSFISDNKSVKSKRNFIKVGKLINKLLPGSFNSSEIEDFVNKYKAQFDSKDLSNFKMVSGSDISKYYNMLEYDKYYGIGQLGKSCMNGCPRELFELYDKNPDKIRLLVLSSDDGEIMGRSLVWKTENGFYFMDRIYTSKDSDIELFKIYANENNMWYKKDQSTSYTNRVNFQYDFTIINNKDTKDVNIVVNLDNSDVENYPYLDSLCYFNRKTGDISNSRYEIEADILITNVDGSYKDSDFEWVF